MTVPYEDEEQRRRNPTGADSFLQRQRPFDEGPLYVDPGTGFAERMPSVLSGASPPPVQRPAFLPQTPAAQPSPAAAAQRLSGEPAMPPEPAGQGLPVVSRPLLQRTSDVVTRERETPEEKRLAGEKKGLLAEAERADKKQEEIVRRAGALAKEQAVIEQDKAEEVAAYETSLAREREAMRAEQDAKVAAARDRLLTEKEKFSKMELRDFWADKSTGKKIAAVMAVGFGGLAAGILGTSNSTLDILNKAVDDDFRLQRAQIQKQAEEIANATGDVEQARQFLADAETRINAKHSEALKKVEAKYAARLKAQGYDVAQIAQDKGLLSIGEQAREREQAAITNEMQRQQGLRARTTSTTMLVDPELAKGGAAHDLSIYGPGGVVIGRAKDPKTAAEVNKSNGAFAQLDNILGQLEAGYKKDGVPLNPFGDAWNSKKTLEAQAIVAYKNMAELGALSGPDMGLVISAIGGGLTGEQSVAKLRKARELLAQGQAKFMDARGVKGEQAVQSLTQPQGGGKALSEQDRAALEWAKQHPGDERAKKILRLHGM